MTAWSLVFHNKQCPSAHATVSYRFQFEVNRLLAISSSRSNLKRTRRSRRKRNKKRCRQLWMQTSSCLFLRINGKHVWTWRSLFFTSPASMNVSLKYLQNVNRPVQCGLEWCIRIIATNTSARIFILLFYINFIVFCVLPVGIHLVWIYLCYGALVWGVGFVYI